eukprot:g45737.t1
MGPKFAPQYANMFMHKVEQDFFAAHDLQPTLYTRCNNNIFFLWTHGKESLKRLHNDIKEFHPTIKPTMDYSLESVSFLDTCISTKDGHLSTSHYRKPMDNLTMLHISSHHSKHVKRSHPLRKKALRTHRTCSNEEECDGHLQMLKDALIRTGYDAQLINRQFQCATRSNHKDLLRRRAQDMTERVPFIIQYFAGAKKLRYVLRSLQHVINDNERLAQGHLYASISCLQTTTKLQRDHYLQQTTQPSGEQRPQHQTTLPQKPLQDMPSIIDIDTTITHGNATHHIY